MKRLIILITLLTLTFSIVSCQKDSNLTIIYEEGINELDNYLNTINNANSFVIDIINDAKALIKTKTNEEEIKEVITNAKQVVTNLLEEQTNILLNLNITLDEHVIRWTETPNATYELIINDEKLITDKSFVIIESYPVTIKIKVATDTLATNYSEPITFNGSKDISKTLTYSFINDDLANKPAIELSYKPNYYYLYDSNFQLIPVSNYESIDNKIVLANYFINSFINKVQYYLVTDQEIIIVKYNILKNISQIQADGIAELDDYLNTINNANSFVIDIINEAKASIKTKTNKEEIKEVITNAKQVVTNLLEEQTNVLLNLNITLDEHVIRWTETPNATYDLIINDEKLITNKPFVFIDAKIVTIEIKVSTDTLSTNYSNKKSFTKADENNKKITFNYYNNENNDLPKVSMFYQPSYYYLYNESFELINVANYIYSNNEISFTDDFIKKMTNQEKYYLVTNRETIVLNFNILTTNKPYIITPVIYTDYTNELVISLQLNGGTISIDEKLLPKDSYKHVDNKIIITDLNYIESLFSNNERNVFIFAITISLDSSHFASLIFIYPNK